MFIIRRSAHNPLLLPRREVPWEALATFNPSVLKTKNGLRMYYRALANPAAPLPYAAQSTIGTAFSEDGTHFHSRKQLLAPQEAWEQYGLEDPRATFFEGKYYVFYTALGGYPFGPDNIKVAVAVGDHADDFTERHLVTPFNAKAAALFPERVNGEAVLLLTAHTDWTAEYPRPTIAIARAKDVNDFWDPAYWTDWHAHLADHAIPNLRRADHDHIEVGAAPLKTEKGWLLVYSYIQDFYDEHERIFSVEAALLDADDPQKLVSRTYPFLVPEEIYELYGIVPDIVFPTSTLIDGHELQIFYGAADTTCAKASVPLRDLLQSLDPAYTARTFVRSKENPILSPIASHPFESQAVFNAAAIDLEGSVHILYRAMSDDNTSTIGYARSKDGITMDERLSVPVYGPRADFELKLGGARANSGCEDPRVVVIGDRLYMTYTAYDGAHPPHGAITSISVDDFLHQRFDAWTEPMLATPDEVDDKDLALLPELVDGKAVLYHRISGRICADVVPDLAFNKPASRCIEIMGPRPGMWDSAKVGIAGTPIKVKEGWLFIYHGVSDSGTYRLGAALLDPSGLAVLARTADPFFEPVAPYEKEGIVPKVVFSCGAIVRGDTLFLYYGGGDKVLGVATASVRHLLSALT